MVNISIEASFLNRAPSGVRNYVVHLIRLGRFVGEDIRLQALGIRNSESRLTRLLWEACGVGVASWLASTDLLHVPHLSAPIASVGKRVVTVHDTIPYSMPEYRESAAMRAYLELMKRTVRRADTIIVPSEFVRGEMPKFLDIDPGRIMVVPMGVDADMFEACPDRKLPQSPYIFNIAGFDARKNLPVLLEAFAQFRSSGNSEWRLVVAGAPHSENSTVFPPVQPVVDRLGLAGVAEFPGRISEAQKRTLYAGASMYVTPSLGEGFGMTVLEAMAAGVPTIGSNRGSLPEVIGDAGLCVEPTADAVYAAMHSLVSDSDGRDHFVRKGRARARQYSWEATLAGTVDVYRRTLDG